MTHPVVTVVIPTHNRSALVRVAVASALRQADVELEVVVVDDASSDGTAALLAAVGDDRLRVVRLERNIGMTGARNRGLAEARGRWVSFCDDDDVWAPSKLSQQVAAAERCGRAWAYTGAVAVDADLHPVALLPWSEPDDIAAALRTSSAVPAGASNVLVRADVARDVGGFDPSFRHCADWDLWLRLAAVSLPSGVPEPLVAYRRHAANDSALHTASVVAELELLEQRGVVDGAAMLRWAARMAFDSGRLTEGAMWLARAQRAKPDPRQLYRDARRVARHAHRRLRGQPTPTPQAQAFDPALADAESWLRPLRQFDS